MTCGMQPQSHPKSWAANLFSITSVYRFQRIFCGEECDGVKCRAPWAQGDDLVVRNGEPKPLKLPYLGEKREKHPFLLVPQKSSKEV